MPSADLRVDPATLNLITAGGILATFLVAMLVVRVIWMRVLRPLVKRTGTQLDDVVLPPARGLVLWGIFLAGIYHSTATLSYVQANAEIHSLLAKVLSIAWVILAIVTVLRVFNGIVPWYVQRAAGRQPEPWDINHRAGLIRKAVNVGIIAIGFVYLLRAAGVDISPLLASGAIGGLAVALALQDTLSNLFAGFFMAIDRPVKVGDYIKLETGEEGFVEEIGWRNTKVRLWANNLVIIPNSKLSQNRITNFYLPRQEMSVYVPCGVAYDSDLQRVEGITVEVAREVMARVEGSQTEWEPVVRWKEFGDFAITFITVLRVKEFSAQYLLQSEFVKALHRRYQEEGIEIPFPMRTVIVKSTNGEAGEGRTLAGAGAAAMPPDGLSPRR